MPEQPDNPAIPAEADHPQLNVPWRHDRIGSRSFHMIRSADNPPSMIVADDVYPAVAAHIVALHNAALAASGLAGENARLRAEVHQLREANSVLNRVLANNGCKEVNIVRAV